MTCVPPFKGSDGTESNCLRFMKGSKVLIKNGTIKTIAPAAAILVQNFADELILDNVKLQGKMTTSYILSNNRGKVILRNGTTVKASSGCVAFDVCYGLTPECDDGVEVVIEDSTVTVIGKVEYTKSERVEDTQEFLSKSHLYIPKDYEGVVAPEGYQFKLTEDGTRQELVPIN